MIRANKYFDIMRALIILLLSFSLVSLPLLGENGGPYGATATNVSCDANTLTFDLSLTDNELPA
jgi:hypothetical protein